MEIYLDDSGCRKGLYPFSHTRHCADIRVGILTIREKWELLTGAVISTSNQDKPGKAIIIRANLIPSKQNFQRILSNDLGGVRVLRHPWEIFHQNDDALREDFALLTGNRESKAISDTNKVIGKQVFVEEGSRVEHSVLNSETGPVYIGKNAMIMEGCQVRGPFALGEGAVLKMGTKIYGATTLGPFCVGGGEIKNSVLFGYSNKAHEGYLGDSVLGEWCNLGAGTSVSNVMNTGGPVKYRYDGLFIEAGDKGGLLMGDYSRTAINTSCYTGTIVGVCCNIFGNILPSKYIANFSWGGERYIFEKAIRDIRNWKKFKGQELTQEEEDILRQLHHSNL